MKQILIELSKRDNFTKITLDKESYLELKKEILKNIKSPLIFKNTSLNATTIDNKTYEIIVKYSYNSEIFIKFE